MPDAPVAEETDPKADWRIRDVPRSVRLWHRGQAAARGFTVAQWLAEVKRFIEEETQ